jgi:hypothetical protein
MNREDIIRMEREAVLTGLMEVGLIDYFERFAALVAAAEREACVRACDAVIERMHDEGEGPTGNIGWVKDCIDAIRARGEK